MLLSQPPRQPRSWLTFNDMKEKGKFKILIAIALVLISPVILYYGFLFYAHDFNPDFISIDSCLDAGGSWDYQNQRCNLPIDDDSGLQTRYRLRIYPVDAANASNAASVNLNQSARIR